MATEPLTIWNVTEPEIMNVPERFDADSAADLYDDVMLCINSGARSMVLDCRDLVTLTGAGLRVMLMLAKEFQQRKGELVICNLQGEALTMFEACSFDEIIPSYSNQRDAVAKLAA